MSWIGSLYLMAHIFKVDDKTGRDRLAGRAELTGITGTNWKLKLGLVFEAPYKPINFRKIHLCTCFTHKHKFTLK